MESQLCFNFAIARPGEEDTHLHVNIEYFRKSDDHKAVRFSLLFAVEICFYRSVDFWSWKLDPGFSIWKFGTLKTNFFKIGCFVFLSTIFAMKRDGLN